MTAMPRSLARAMNLALRTALAATLVLAAACTGASAQTEETRDTVRLTVRRTAAVSLSETPSTGYRWRLNPGESRNLRIVGVADSGFSRPTARRPAVGGPGVRRFQIVARRPGSAVVVFDYARPWEQTAPARRHTVTVEAVPRPRRALFR
jgi:inhibitor of cysteine peptidase